MTFKVTNWFVWIVEAHKAGMSDADILWILKVLDVLEPLRAILAKEEEP